MGGLAMAGTRETEEHPSQAPTRGWVQPAKAAQVTAQLVRSEDGTQVWPKGSLTVSLVIQSGEATALLFNQTLTQAGP